MGVVRRAFLAAFLWACSDSGSGPFQQDLIASVSGDGQTGLAGNALADSLQVVATDASGFVRPNVAIRWRVVSGGGRVAPQNGVTDANGYAAAQYVAGGAGPARVEAAMTGAAPVRFDFDIRTPSACLLELPTNYQIALRPRGSLRGVVLYVDFSDAPAVNTTPHTDPSFVWFETVSHGQLTATVTAVPGWFRLPQPSTSYFIGGRLMYDDVFRDAVLAADSAVDFAAVDLVYVIETVASPGVAIILEPGTGPIADGHEVRHGAVVVDPASNTLMHETGHTFGLLDLYSYVDGSMPAGWWDIMSNTRLRLLAYHRQKLGWLTPEQSACFDVGGVEAVLDPVERPGGLKLIVARTSLVSVYAIEARARIYEDVDICGDGVLVYRIEKEQPPVTVAGDLGCRPQLGFDSASGQTTTFNDPNSGITIRLIGASGNPPTYRVAIKHR